MNALYQIQQTISEAEIIIRERQRELDTAANKLGEVKKQIADITGSSDTGYSFSQVDIHHHRFQGISDKRNAPGWFFPASQSH